MVTNNFTALLAMIIVFGLGIVGCDFNDGPVEKAGEKVDSTVDKAGDKAEQAGDNMKGAVDK